MISGAPCACARALQGEIYECNLRIMGTRTHTLDVGQAQDKCKGAGSMGNTTFRRTGRISREFAMGAMLPYADES